MNDNLPDTLLRTIISNNLFWNLIFIHPLQNTVVYLMTMYTQNLLYSKNNLSFNDFVFYL